jgi:thiol-disulfide isomerase/thioredoxin
MRKLIHRTVPALLISCALLAPAYGPAYARTAPNLDLKDLAGHPQKLSTLRGQIVVLSFWATWCGPCREELPRLSRLSEAYAGKNVRFIAVSIDDRKDFVKIQPFLQQQNVHLDVWIGADVDTLGRFGLGDIVPGTVVIDQQGNVITLISGEAQDADVRTRLDWLLNGRQGPAPEEKLKRY